MFQKVKFSTIAICLLLTMLVTSSVQASLPQSIEINNKEEAFPSISIEATPEDQKTALEIWTREARAAAEPLSFPDVAQDDLKLDALVEPLAEEFGFAAGGEPDSWANVIAKHEFPEEWLIDTNELDIEAPIAPQGTPGVFTSYLANYYSQMHKYFPYKAVGKLYFTTPSGNEYCTASVISRYNIIVTAAHCVYDTANDRWYSNWTFVPADRAGAAPYGTFPWTRARVLRAWVNASGVARRYDVALIRLRNNSSGRPVTYYTGWLGRSWNYGYTQHVHTFGYPSNLNSGRYTYICAAETFYGGSDVLGMGCNMTYGSSGGPWLRVFAPYASGANNYVNAVVSGGTPGTNTFYGPRFSSNNIVPLCNDEGC